MFTGLIEEIGSVRSVSAGGQSRKVEYEASVVLEGTKIGDSISVSGVCQTVTSLSEKTFTTDISAETLKKTTARSLKPGEKVNLERAMCLGDRIGGHLVQGHVNGTGRIISIKKQEDMYLISLSLREEMMRYVIPEGSIAVDGISLTVAQVDRAGSSILLQIIPHSYGMTVLQFRGQGDEVNIETDLFGRYAESLLAAFDRQSLTEKKLKTWGY